MDPVLFPDEATLLIGLLDAVMDVPVAGRVPDPRPPSFLRVYRVGGARRTAVSSGARLVIDGWAQSDTEARDLTALAHAHALAARGRVLDQVQVYVVEDVSGPSEDPDPDSDQPRYSSTVDWSVRGAPLPT